MIQGVIVALTGVTPEEQRAKDALFHAVASGITACQQSGRARFA